MTFTRAFAATLAAVLAAGVWPSTAAAETGGADGFQRCGEFAAPDGETLNDPGRLARNGWTDTGERSDTGHRVFIAGNARNWDRGARCVLVLVRCEFKQPVEMTAAGWEDTGRNTPDWASGHEGQFALGNRDIWTRNGAECGLRIPSCWRLGVPAKTYESTVTTSDGETFDGDWYGLVHWYGWADTGETTGDGYSIHEERGERQDWVTFQSGGRYLTGYRIVRDAVLENPNRCARRNDKPRQPEAAGRPVEDTGGVEGGTAQIGTLAVAQPDKPRAVEFGWFRLPLKCELGGGPTKPGDILGCDLIAIGPSSESAPPSLTGTQCEQAVSLWAYNRHLPEGLAEGSTSDDGQCWKTQGGTVAEFNPAEVWAALSADEILRRAYAAASGN